MAAPEIERMRAAVVRVHPELSGATFEVATAGWHSTALDVDDRRIFKFPRHEAAERALLKEAALLAQVRSAVSMPVPDMRIHEGPPLFSEHVKIEGGHLPPTHYDHLAEDARRQLGEDLGRFYAELHRLDADRMKALGAGPIEPWRDPADIRARALPALPPEIRCIAEQTIGAFEQLPPDPHGTTYGFFDGHGWNMAFDHDRGRLNGVYDFADSGVGPLHQEFIYSNLVSSDLTERIVRSYEALTGRDLDRGRITLLTGMHRLSELSELADDPDHLPAMVRNFERWAASTERPRGPLPARG